MPNSKADLPVSQAAGQRRPADLRLLVLECAAHLLVQSKRFNSLAVARRQAEDCLKSGGPRRKWDEMLLAQGANLAAFNQKLALDHTAAVVVELKSPGAGFVSRCDARIIGEVIRDLGGGRLTKESAIHPEVGLDHLAKPGERVQKNSVLARIHAASQAQAKSAVARVLGAFEISVKPPKAVRLVQQIIQ